MTNNLRLFFDQRVNAALRFIRLNLISAMSKFIGTFAVPTRLFLLAAVGGLAQANPVAQPIDQLENILKMDEFKGGFESEELKVGESNIPPAPPTETASKATDLMLDTTPETSATPGVIDLGNVELLPEVPKTDPNSQPPAISESASPVLPVEIPVPIETELKSELQLNVAKKPKTAEQTLDEQELIAPSKGLGADSDDDDEIEESLAENLKPSGWDSESSKPRNLGEDFKFKFGLVHPSFTKLLHHDEFYGGPSNHFTFHMDRYFWGGEFPLGLSLHTGYYRDTGHPSRTKNPRNGVKFERDEIDFNQNIRLVLIPIQLNLVSHWHLFNKLLVVDLWGGWERLVVQETRETQESEATKKADSENGSKTATNRGQNDGIVMGLALGGRIDQLERHNQDSLNSMGIGAIYFQLFFEVVSESSKDMGDFSRNSIGLLFSFESN